MTLSTARNQDTDMVIRKDKVIIVIINCMTPLESGISKTVNMQAIFHGPLVAARRPNLYVP